jgi:hypothetical protein
MLEDFREFEAGPDPFGRTWKATFLWQQNAISIRHADTIDVKFAIDDGVTREEKVVAVPHPLLLQLSARTGQPVTDAWVSRLGAAHLREMIATGEDTEKVLVTMTAADLDRANEELGIPAAADH